MAKLIAILNVVAWAGFWAFGYLALSAEGGAQMTTAVILAVIGGALGLGAWFWLVRHYPATRISAFTLLTPVFGLLAGVGLLGEPLTLRLGVALVAVCAGIWLVNRVRPAGQRQR